MSRARFDSPSYSTPLILKDVLIDFDKTQAKGPYIKDVRTGREGGG